MKSTAAGLAALGRGPDSMLVHMSPREVAGLQQLAMAHGGSLTTNPHTGLPEAGFLDSMLPMIIGVGLNFLAPGVGTAIGSALGGLSGAAGTGLLVGGLQTLRTGDLGKGLMAGLGAYGGAGLGEALTAQGAGIAGHNAGLQAIGGPEAFTGASFAQPIPNAAATMNPTMDSSLTEELSNAAFDFSGSTPKLATAPVAPTPAPTNVPNPLGQAYRDAYQAAQPTDAMGRLRAAGTGLQNITEPGFTANLGQQFNSTPAKAAAGIGAIGALGGFEQPQLRFGMPQQAPSNAKLSGPIRRPYDPERNLYTDYGILQPTYAAKGGEMHSVPQLEDGGFVLTKRAVDGMGKGSNERGQRAAAAGLGAIPIKGPGTGTSDSIPTSIDGVRPAKVSNGEAYVPRKRVKQAGGAKRLYALMRQAENDARRRAA